MAPDSFVATAPGWRVAVVVESTAAPADLGASGEPLVVEMRGLRKQLGRRVVAVDGLDLSVRRGEVLGLAGENGSGKSMTLRILLGLVHPDAGEVRLFGDPVRPGAPALSRVGALIDGPGFVPHLSGLDNLRLAARLCGRPIDANALDAALAVADLGPAIRRRYRTYSHGMRYRLGLAQATLGDPDLLVLDEPTTGLDPVHIRAVRAVVSAAAQRGGTVVLSSHLLGEVERTCTRVAIMQRGRVVLSGSVDALVGDGRRSLEQLYLDLADSGQLDLADSGQLDLADSGGWGSPTRGPAA